MTVLRILLVQRRASTAAFSAVDVAGLVSIKALDVLSHMAAGWILSAGSSFPSICCSSRSLCVVPYSNAISASGLAGVQTSIAALWAVTDTVIVNGVAIRIALKR